MIRRPGPLPVLVVAPIVALAILPAACATAPHPPAKAPGSSTGPSTGPSTGWARLKPRPPVVRPAPKAAPGVNTAAVLYRCAAGKTFTAAWGQAGDRVRVKAGGMVRSLPAARSASGARYSDGKFEIWGKGDQAMLTGFPGGPYQGCRAG
jgi:membrane-bound inhibitor of C-type lysozyme